MELAARSWVEISRWERVCFSAAEVQAQILKLNLSNRFSFKLRRKYFFSLGSSRSRHLIEIRLLNKQLLYRALVPY